jgi:hypothetical protein
MGITTGITTGITSPPTAQSWDVIEGPDGRVSQLLSLDEVCRALGMGKSWAYRRIKSGQYLV